jgi:hypothetical protein
VGYSFGSDYTMAFLAVNNLELMVRSHEVKDDGYVEEHDGKCITVFSAPNYCDQVSRVETKHHSLLVSYCTTRCYFILNNRRPALSLLVIICPCYPHRILLTTPLP